MQARRVQPYQTKQETLEYGGQEDGRNTTVKPNVTNEAKLFFSFLFFFLNETTLPYFGYCRIQFFFFE